MPRKAPEQKPGESEQVVCTPDNFLKAVKKRFDYMFEMTGGEFAYDLAADSTNAVATKFFDESANSLAQDWSAIEGTSWCNPPFAHIKPWVEKAAIESKKGASLLMLLPASVGSDWWRDYVHTKAWVFLLNGRLIFKGHKTYYPKDLVLLAYHRALYELPTYTIWNWRENIDK